MGRDKAGVIFEGQPLWERQLSTLRQLVPNELFISGKLNGPYAGAGVEILQDATPDCGPLSGLEAALLRSTQPRVLILAIDLPAMTVGVLAYMLHMAKGIGGGIVGRFDKWFEPLAAVYTRECLALVQDRLRGQDFSMQALIQEMIDRQLMTPVSFAEEYHQYFRNLNSPADLEGG